MAPGVNDQFTATVCESPVQGFSTRIMGVLYNLMYHAHFGESLNYLPTLSEMREAIVVLKPLPSSHACAKLDMWHQIEGSPCLLDKNVQSYDEWR